MNNVKIFNWERLDELGFDYYLRRESLYACKFFLFICVFFSEFRSGCGLFGEEISVIFLLVIFENVFYVLFAGGENGELGEDGLEFVFFTDVVRI